MLVLSRRIGESIVIGNTIRVTVVDIGQGRVKIGVQAPGNVSVDREEIHDRKLVEREIRQDMQSVDLEVEMPITVHNRLNHLVDSSTDPLPTVKGKPAPFRRKPR